MKQAISATNPEGILVF